MGYSSSSQSQAWWRYCVVVALQLSVFVTIVLFLVGSPLERSDVTSEQHYYSAQADSQDQLHFDVWRALKDLSEISKATHSLNDPNSIRVRDYLRTRVRDAIGDAVGVEFSDPAAYTNDTDTEITAEFRHRGWMVYWEDSSLVVRVPGTDGSRKEALLVQAHYDAVPMSHGTFDDGIGVVVCLELLRNLIKHPVRHPVVINMDWGEESGLLGAIMFARFHPWAEDVRAYINLEAGGVGGQAMLFRASHLSLLSAYKQVAKKPCASLIGDNAFKLGVVKSDTDYSIYTTRYGVPGLDIAFTDHRNLYHTARDYLDYATGKSVLSMGDITLATARQIANSPDILPSLPRSSRLPERPAQDSSISSGKISHDTDPTVPYNVVEDAVFYDILSRFMVVRSYTAEMLVNVATALVGIIAIVALQYPFTRPRVPFGPGISTESDGDLAIQSTMERLVLQLGYGGFFGGLFEGTVVLIKATLASLFGALIFTGIIVSLVFPRLAYSHLTLCLLLIFAASMLSVTCVATAWVCKSRLPDIKTMVWYSWALLKCLVLLFVVAPLNSVNIGILYREQLYAWTSLVAILLTAMLDPHTGIYKLWRQGISKLTTRTAVTSSQQDEEEEDHSQRLLPDNNDSHDRDKGHIFTAVGVHVIAGLRLIVCALLPIAISMDTMLRQLRVFKDHLPDGSPPIACVGIAAFDITTFSLLVMPYLVGAIKDIDNFWLVSLFSRRIMPHIQNHLQPWRQRVATIGNSLTRSRSQISLHTNHPYDERNVHDTASSVHQEAEEEVAEDDTSERIILLGSTGQRDGQGNAEPSTTITTAQDDDENDNDDYDDELGRRPPQNFERNKSEAPEIVGKRLIYMWTCVWFAVWIIAQLLTLAGEGYDQLVNPLKIRVFQSTHLSAKCLVGRESKTEISCVSSRLSLMSPDSVGLAKVVNAATAADDIPHSCFARNTQGFYQCNLSNNKIAAKQNSQEDEWQPDTAIEVTSIKHVSSQTDNGGTLFTVSMNFTAKDTRTCLIDLGKHFGFSMQAYPNPYPAVPPASNQTTEPSIGRTLLPVIERAGFVDGVSGFSAPIVEPVNNRDVVYSNRIYAHKRDFDHSGNFSAIIQYSLPVANAPRPSGALVDISCYFDVVDQHTKLLSSVIHSAPGWAIFTPDGNVLSSVTLTDVEI